MQEAAEALLEWLLNARDGVERAVAADYIAAQDVMVRAICVMMLADKLSPIFDERAPIAGVN